MRKKELKKIKVFEYDNYRTYLRDLYEYLKKNTPEFSFRYFSQTAGFRSPNFLQLVIEGKRNLSADSIEKFIRALKLNKKEADHFRILVHLNQAKTIDEKKFYADQLMRTRSFKHIHPLKQNQYDYYSQWYNIPIRELVAHQEFSEDPAWIAKNLNPPISPQQAKKALELLLELDLIKRDESGRLVQTDTVVSTGDEVTSTSVANYHHEMIKKGSEAIDRFPSKERDISSVTMAVSEKGFNEIKSIIQRFRKEIIAVANQEQDPEAVCQVNIQLFPLTRKIKEESEE